MEFLKLDQPQTILVIEDKLSFARRLVQFLEGKGHTVYGYDGVLSIEEKVLTGTNTLTDSTPFEVDLSKINLCFLDHYFQGDHYNGTSMTQILVAFGVKVCGMSSVDPANASMLRYGAICAYRKDMLARMLGI